MKRPDVEARVLSLGAVVHHGVHAVAVQLPDGTGLVVLDSEVDGEHWIELRVWAGGAAEAPLAALLERNARLSYGAFCVVEGELFLRAAIAAATLDAAALERAIAGMLGEVELLRSFVHPAAAAEDCFGYLA